MEAFNAEKIRKDFPLLRKGIVYLDNAATTQKPLQVINAISEYYTEYNANIHRGVYAISVRSTTAYEEAHQKAANFINASIEEVIFTPGTTGSLNMLAYTLVPTLKPGDEIVLTEMEHHSNLVPWQQLAKERGLAVRFIPLAKDMTLDMAKAEKLITDKTRIVSVTHMSNALGTITPIQEIAELCRRHGALLVVDGAQSIPHMKIDVKALNCDFFAFSAHKLFGPTGLGVLYGKKEHLKNMKPFLYGGDMIREVRFEDSTWNDLPWKFEAGTPDISGAIGFAASLDYISRIGMEHIHSYESDLLDYCLTELRKIEGITLYGPGSYGPGSGKQGPIISFNLDGIHAHDVATILDREHIAIRGGHHCAMPLMKKLGISGTSRISLAFYNTKEDIDRAVRALRRAREVFSR